jgi:proteasome assembly chaperone (PAC2) family protein
MSDAVEIREKPAAERIDMLAGWRQWADAGSVSSGLPLYLIQKMGARKIGSLRPDGFYIFQIPGTHDLVRPVVKFDQGFPEQLEAPHNDLYYAGDSQRGIVIFLGDEPHLDVERYTAALREAAAALGVQRVIGFGGVYGELPYEKERMVSAIYSLPSMKEDMDRLAVNLSDYHGGASIGSYTCRRFGDHGMEFTGLYAFVPNYELPGSNPAGNSIRVETDFMAWLGVMRRVNYMLKLDFDLADLEEKSQNLVELMAEKIDEIDRAAPELGVREALQRLSDEFVETTFEPLDDIWEDQIRRLFDKFDTDDPS